MTHDQYIRQMILASVAIIYVLPMVIFNTVVNDIGDSSFKKWPGFKAVHDDFSQTPALTVAEWAAHGTTNIMLTSFMFLQPIEAVAYFAIMGTMSEVRNWY